MGRVSGIIPYMGSKGLMINSLQKVFQSTHFDVFCDLFGGSGTVTMYAKVDCPYKIINDIKPEIAILPMTFANADLTNLFIDRLNNFCLTQEVFDSFRAIWSKFKEADLNNKATCPKEEKLQLLKKDNLSEFIELALSAYVLQICSYAGVLRNCKTTITNEHLNKIKKYLSPIKIGEYQKCFENVIVYNRDSCDIIQDMVDNPDNKQIYMIYLDVPYLSSNESDSIITGDTYGTGANDEWHLRLLNLLNKLPVDNYQVVISNHSNDLYDEYINTHFGKWYKIRIGSRTNNCANGNNCKKKSVVGEYLYSNFKIDI